MYNKVNVLYKDNIFNTRLSLKLLRNLQTLSMNDTVEQCSFASCYNYQKDSETAFKETGNDRWKSKELVMAFTKLLEVK